MRALLDVNVLLALFDRAHVHHVRAREWFTSRAKDGWASCPLTQNGFVRIISQPRYPQPITTPEAIALLQAATATNLHEFWPADITLLDEAILDRTRVHGPRQLTDLYLLALAVRRGGCLATFDDAIPRSAVPGAGPHHVVLV
jgi:toxin-antitoxin system PIN domain toxin